MERLRGAGIRTSLFIDPDEDAVRHSAALGVEAIELHTGEYANARTPAESQLQVDRLRAAAVVGREVGLDVHAGHGLTYQNVIPVAAIREIEELNIGFAIVARALFVGLRDAVREMRDEMLRAREISLRPEEL